MKNSQNKKQKISQMSSNRGSVIVFVSVVILILIAITAVYSVNKISENKEPIIDDSGIDDVIDGGDDDSIVDGDDTKVTVNNFEDCAYVGNYVVESNPAQCTHNGVTYIQKLPTGIDGGDPKVKVTNYIECVKAGNMPTASYPGRCTHNGETYTQIVDDMGIYPPPEGELITSRLNERVGSFLIHNAGTDSISGLWFEAYPLPSLVGTPRTINIGDDIGHACEGISIKLEGIHPDGVNGTTITFRKVVKEAPIGGCPI